MVADDARWQYVAFSQPYFFDNLRMITRKPVADSPGLFAYLTPLSGTVWGLYLGERSRHFEKVQFDLV